jgi:hypothetical protein
MFREEESFVFECRPEYEHEAKDVSELLRCMRREGIRPVDGDPREAKRLLPRPAPIRNLKRHSPVEMAQIWDLPLSFILGLEEEIKWGAYVCALVNH